MITPEEIRIGNIILFNDQPIVVVGVGKNYVMLDGYVFETGNPQYPYEYHKVLAGDERVKPFPLKDFLLEQIFGKYSINGHREYKFQGPFFIGYEEERGYNNEVIEERTGYFVGMYFGKELIHVTPHHFWTLHELQNIHIAQYGYDFTDFDTVKRVWNLAVRIGKIS